MKSFLSLRVLIQEDKMYVGLVKLNKVWYRISTFIPDDVIESGMWKKIYTYCVFDKQTEEMEFDGKKSHLRFMGDELKRQKIHAQVKLIKIRRAEEEYPFSTSVETGG